MFVLLFLNYLPMLLSLSIVATMELLMPLGKPTKEAKAETKTHPATVESKVSRYNLI